MRILFNSSVLVAALVKSHFAHNRALPWLKRVIEGSDAGVAAAHSLAEVYAVLTTLPAHPRISPAIARQLIQQNIIALFEIVALSSTDYMQVIEDLSARGIIGGATYDALILKAAENVQVDQVVTLNERDFRRIYPELASKIIAL